MEFTVRHARTEDAPAVREIVRGVLAEYGLPPDPGGIDRDLEDIDAFYLSRGGGFLVAVAADGTIVGSCGVLPLDATTWELRKMYLRQDVRGRGLGKQLLAQALDLVRSRGGKRVELETASVLVEAIGLYTAAGFRQLPRAPDATRCDKAFALDL
jgi:GNAT superfamily N-acetyltransferase